MAKIKLKERDYLARLSSTTNGMYYKQLVALLKCRLATVQDSMVDAGEDEFKQLQGKAQELRHLLKGLTRKALKPQSDGAYR